MLTILINTCTDCGDLQDAMCEMDGAIAQSGKDSYFNLIYLSDHKTVACDIIRLSWYREILQELNGNSGYYCPQFAFADIVSRARALVAGLPKVAKRWVLPAWTTTTTSTTSTTSTTTTSTTSTTTTSTSTTTTTT